MLQCGPYPFATNRDHVMNEQQKNQLRSQRRQLRIQQFGNHLGEAFFALENETHVAYEKLYLFKEIYLNSNRMDLMNNVSPGFFGIVASSLLESLVLHVTRSTDRAKTGPNENVTLFQFSEHLNEPDRTVVSPYVDTARDVAKPVINWRHKHYAHLDLATILNAEISSVALTQIEDSLDSIEEAIKRIEDQVTSNVTYTRDISREVLDAPQRLFRHLE